MKTVKLTQGTPEWHAHRDNYFNASDAPAMMGCSPYETRSALVARLATGIAAEVSPQKQRIFDSGHAFEVGGRESAEIIVEEDLYPVTGVSDCGKYSASFDGLTMCETIAFEHKTLNKELASLRCFNSGDAEAAGLAERYLVQMEHQLMVSGANQCLFGATNGGADDALWLHYYPNAERRAAIIAGWEQLAKDVAEYRPTEAAAPVFAEAVETLPTLFATVAGTLTVNHNMAVFKSQFDGYIADIKTTLTTDQDFADAKANAKACGDIEDKLNLAADQLIAQNASVAEVVEFARSHAGVARQMRLRLDSLVKSEQVARKNELLNKADDDFEAYVECVNVELKKLSGIDLASQPKRPDWRSAIANKRSLSSIKDALDTALAQGKIAVDAAAKIVRANIAHLHTAAPDHGFLFSDLQLIATKSADDFANLVAQRLTQHQDRIAREAQAEADRREAKAKAEAERAAREAQVAPAVIVPATVMPSPAPPPEPSPKPVPTNDAPPSEQPKITLCELRFEQWLNKHNKAGTDELWECWWSAWATAGGK